MPSQGAKQQFDVFMCHNSEDKAAVIEIADRLRQCGMKPWLDVWEIRPGAIWQFALEQQIESIGAAAVFVGQYGVGPWQSEEVYALLQEFIQRGCPVIPVMLPETQTQPRLPIFLKNRHWVDFRVQMPDPISQLLWGITGEKSDLALDVSKSVSIRDAERMVEESDVVGDRYADLEGYLQNGEWKKADKETYRLMITEVGKKEGQWFDSEDLLNFPFEPLKTIDGLWVCYSEGRFGFSVQKKIYEEKCGGISNGKYDSKALLKFLDEVGWKELRYDILSPKGHLPLVIGLPSNWVKEIPDSFTTFLSSIKAAFLEGFLEQGRVCPYVDALLSHPGL